MKGLAPIGCLALTALGCGKVLGAQFDNLAADQGAESGGASTTSADGAGGSDNPLPGGPSDAVATSGGASVGGASVGGASSGGASVGGASVGGASVGGTSAGGALSSNGATSVSGGGMVGGTVAEPYSGGNGGHTATSSATQGLGGTLGETAIAGAAGEAATTDGPVEPPQPTRCDPALPFSQIVRLEGLPAGSAMARATPDELTVYYAWITSDQKLELGVAHRDSVDSAFGPGEPLTLLNSPDFDESPSLSADGLTLYFGSSRTGNFRIHQGTRSALDETFSSPTLIEELAIDGAQGGGPYFLPESSELYFHSNRNGDASDLFVATVHNGVFDTPVPVAGVNSDYMPESFPVVSSDRLTLYFTRTTDSGQNVWVATRLDPSQPFGDSRPVSELNTDRVDLPSWISPDLCRLYFTSRDETWWGGEVYQATREPLAAP